MTFAFEEGSKLKYSLTPLPTKTAEVEKVALASEAVRRQGLTE